MKYSNFLKTVIISALLSVSLTACMGEEPAPKQERNVQAQKAKDAANSISFAENAEIANIKARLELTANPGLLGYIILLNETGQPVMYTGVKGKVTSGGKRLTDPKVVVYKVGGSNGNLTSAVTDAPSDEGTYGHSGDYIFFWTTAGQYVQWNGKFLYSDKPFRLSTEPLVVSLK